MKVMLRIPTAGRQLEFGIATTRTERAAVAAQRFRVFRRSGYHRPGLCADRDDYDPKSIYVFGVLRDRASFSIMLGSARLVVGEGDETFIFPLQTAFALELPDAIRKIPMNQRQEVTRMVAERPPGIPLRPLLTPLGLMQSVSLYGQHINFRCGIGMIKQRFLRALRAHGVPFHDIPGARVIYPRDGAMAGYHYQHPDPAIPVYWLAEEIVPAVAHAIGRSQDPQRGGSHGCRRIDAQ